MGIAQNRASTERIRAVAARLSDDEMQHAVGERWTVAIALAHLAFWDRRVMYDLDMTERDGKLFIPEIDIFVNDLSLPLCGRRSRRAPPRGSRLNRLNNWTNDWKVFRQHYSKKSTPTTNAGSCSRCTRVNISMK
ncbi:MAG: hypothetical protein HY868_11210 [Chloroflexi bacterium]|nr:hypothetical protein [Chloroflexota bacterium]